MPTNAELTAEVQRLEAVAGDAQARLALAIERNEQLVAERDFLRRVVIALVEPEVRIAEAVS